MKKFSRNEWLGIGIGFALGFFLCLIGIGFWPPEDKLQNHATPNPDGSGEYQEISESFGERFAGIAERTFDDPIALYTFVLVVFTGLLGFATVRLWFVTKELVRGADDTAKRQLRAYVGPDGFEFDIRSIEDGYVPKAPYASDLFTDFTNITCKNFGQTPASNVTVFCAVASITPFLGRLPPGYDFDAKLHPPGDDSSNIIARAYLNRGQTDVSSVNLADPRIVWSARKRTSTLFIFGRIYYVDAFGTQWSTKFCSSWEPWHPSGPRFVASDEYNGEDNRAPP